MNQYSLLNYFLLFNMHILNNDCLKDRSCQPIFQLNFNNNNINNLIAYFKPEIMRAVRNAFAGFNEQLNASLPLKISLWLSVSFISLSIIFSIIYPIIGCGYYGFSMPCSHYFIENPNTCFVNSAHYCCGTQGNIACESYINCLEILTPMSIPKCAGVLITSWVLQGLTLLGVAVFIWLLCRTRTALLQGPDYRAMQNSEV